MSNNFKTNRLLKLVDQDCLNLILVRHGQAGGSGTLEGLLSPVLTKMGENQAERLAEYFAALPLDCIYTSDMARAYQTANAVREFHPQTPFHSLLDLREISPFQVRGRPQARTIDDRRKFHEERERVTRFALHLRRAHKPEQLVAIIAHNGINGMLLAELCGLSYRESIYFFSCHTSVTVANVSMNSSAVSLRLMGCTRHLPATMVTDRNVVNTG